MLKHPLHKSLIESGWLPSEEDAKTHDCIIVRLQMLFPAPYFDRWIVEGQSTKVCDQHMFVARVGVTTRVRDEPMTAVAVGWPIHTLYQALLSVKYGRVGT